VTPVRVLFLQRQPCIRTLKYAVALRSALSDIHLTFAFQGTTLTGYYGTGDEAFDEWIFLGEAAHPAAEIHRAIERARPDVIHSHNLPDLLTVIALEAADGRLPVIHDVHDMQALRQTPYCDGFPEPRDAATLERRAIEGSAALVTVSPELLEEIQARYRPPHDVVVFPNLILARDLLPLVERPLAGPPGIVYEGSLSTDGGHYDLREHFVHLVEQDLRVDVHPARPAPAYVELARPGLTIHDPVDPGALMRTLPGYGVGWAGFNQGLNNAHLDTVLPNKLFEYVAAGLAVATLRHRALARFVSGHGIGVVGDTVADLAARLAEADLEAMRRRARSLRAEITVEGAIGSLIDLYATVAGRSMPVRAA